MHLHPLSTFNHFARTCSTLQEILTILLLIVCSGSSCTNDDDGPGVPPPEPPAAEPDDLEVLWSREIHRYDGYSNGISPQPLDDGGIVAILHAGDSVANVLYHFDPATGEVVDSFFVDDPVFGFGRITEYEPGLRVGDDYIAAVDQWPFRLSLRDGSVRWVVPETYTFGSAHNGRLYSGRFTEKGEEPVIGIIDLATGQVVDSIGMPPGLSLPSDRRIAYSATRAFDRPDGGTTILATIRQAIILPDSVVLREDGTIRPNKVSRRYAFDADTHELLWAQNLGPSHRDPAVDPPIYYDGVIVQAAWDTVFGFDAATGAELWAYNTIAEPFPGDVPLNSPPRESAGLALGSAGILDAEAGVACFGSLNYYQYCLDVATGNEVWRGGTGTGTNSTSFGFIGDGLLSNGSNQTMSLLDRHTGRIVAEAERISGQGIFTGIPYYDPERRIVVNTDGARAIAWSLNVEPPGE